MRKVFYFVISLLMLSGCAKVLDSQVYDPTIKNVKKIFVVVRPDKIGFGNDIMDKIRPCLENSEIEFDDVIYPKDKEKPANFEARMEALGAEYILVIKHGISYSQPPNPAMDFSIRHEVTYGCVIFSASGKSVWDAQISVNTRSTKVYLGDLADDLAIAVVGAVNKTGIIQLPCWEDIDHESDSLGF